MGKGFRPQIMLKSVKFNHLFSQPLERHVTSTRRFGIRCIEIDRDGEQYPTTVVKLRLNPSLFRKISGHDGRFRESQRVAYRARGPLDGTPSGEESYRHDYADGTEDCRLPSS